jgi:transcription elongation factor SPT5
MKKDNDQTEEQTYNIEGIKDFLRNPQDNVAIEESDYEDVSQEEVVVIEKPKKLVKKSKKIEEDYAFEEDYGESEDDDFDENEEDDYDDDLEDKKMLKQKRKRPTEKKKQKKSKKTNRRANVRDFLEFEAESDSEEEEEVKGEITEKQKEALMALIDDKVNNRPKRGRLAWMDQNKYRNEEELENYFSTIDKAQELDEDQHKIPSVEDPKLWLIKCKPGKERDCVNNLFHKYFVLNKEETKVK